LQAGDKEEAFGHFGEATLRLLGVSLAAIQEMKALRNAAKPPATSAAGPEAAPVAPKPEPTAPKPEPSNVTDAAPTRTVVQQQQVQQPQGNGSYTNTHQSGKTYSGKGDQDRMNDSAARIARQHNDPVTSQSHTPAPDTKQSFIDEQDRIDATGGPGGNTYNKINSPGKKLRGN
jgi:hypothetical protein